MIRRANALVVPVGFVLLCAIAWTVSPTASLADKDEAEIADRLLKEAHLHRHFYGKSFPGFEAKLTCVFGGKEIKGKVTVESPGEIEVELPELAARLWVTEQLSIILSHRLTPPEVDARGLSLGEEDGHPLGRLVRVRDRFETSYRIREGRIREVHRNSPPIRFYVAILDYAKAHDGKELPRHFTATYFDSDTGRLIRHFTFQDDYRKVGKYALIRRRMVIGSSDEGMHTVYFELNDHKLLEKKV